MYVSFKKWQKIITKTFFAYFLVQSIALPLAPLTVVLAQEATTAGTTPPPSTSIPTIQTDSTLAPESPESIETTVTTAEVVSPETKSVEQQSLSPAETFATAAVATTGILSAGATANTPQRYRNFYAGTFSGTGSYSFPIQVPPATNEFAPQLQLAYSSGAKNQKNSVAGSGWALSEYSITRDINFTAGNTSDDEFELLLPEGGFHVIYDSVNQEWVTERKSNFKIEKVSGATNDYGESWLITAPNGTKHYFGSSAGSETVCTGKTYVHKWYLEKSEDIHGNEIFYTYSEDVNTETYLTKIEYNSNKTRTIDFTYETRNDYPTNYLDQGCLKIYYDRLKSIETKVDGNLVKKYELTYTYSNNDLNSLLTSITESGSDGAALPATTFEYQSENFAWNASKHTTNSISEDPSLANTNIAVADVNADSRVDIIKSETNGNWKVWLGTNTGWQTTHQLWMQNDDWAVQNGNITIIDINGDGFTDLVRKYSGSEIEVALNNGGHGWNTVGQWYNYGWDMTDANTSFADMNGDGLVDAVKTQGGKLLVRLNGGIDNFGNEQIWADSGMPYLDTFPQRVVIVDVTGDGLADVLQAQEHGDTQVDYKIWVNRGDRVDTSSRDWLYDQNERWSIDNENVRILDANGDSLPDLVLSNGGQSGTEWQVILNNGKGWDKTTESNWSSNGQINYYLNQDQTFIADANGNGVPDIGRGEGGTYYKWDNLNQKANLLTNITTPYGAKATISYTKAQDLDNTGDDAINDLTFPMWVVSQMNTDNQLSGDHNITTSTTYEYQDGSYNYGEKEFRGFGQVTTTNLEGTKTITKYHQDQARVGLPYLVETRDSSDNLYSKTESTYSSSETNGVFHSQLTSQKKYLHDGDNTTAEITQQDFQYDQYDNPTVIHDYGDTTDASDDLYTHNEYTYNTSLNLVSGLVKRSYLNDDDDSTKLSETLVYYDNNLLLSGTPTRGLVTKKENWLDGGSNPVTKFEYDAYGNQTKVINPLNKETTTSYETTHNTFPTSVTNALNQTTTATFDAGTGQVLTNTDSNNYTTSYEYDTLGRVVKEIQPYDSSQYPTKAYSYAYSAGNPYAVTVEQRIEPGTNQVLEATTYSDGHGNTLQTKTEGTEANQFITVDTYYNNLGKAYKTSNPYYTATISYAAPDTSVAATSTTFDAVGRKIQTTFPDNTTAQTSYDKWHLTYIDPNNKTLDHYLDARGNIVAIEEHNNGSTYTTSYNYTAKGELTTITDNANNTFNWIFDTLGRKTSYTNPAGKTTSYGYDAASQLTSETDPENITITTEYDDLGRVTKIDYPTQTDVTYTYDTNLDGTLASKVTGDASYSYQYDQRYRTTSETISIDSKTETTSYTYNSLDVPKTISSSLTGKTQTFSFAGNGEVTGLTGVITNIAYNVFGKITGREYANGATTSYDYDAISSRLTRITTQASANTIQDFGYRYDAIGNVSNIVDNYNDVSKSYSYDDLHRLVGMSQTDGQNITTYAYSYDSIGNMLTAVDQSGNQTSYSYAENNYGPHQLTSVAIGGASIDQAPAFTSTPVKSVDEGASYSYQLAATDPEAGSVSFSLVAGPDGMTINGNNQVVWQVGALDAGEYLVLIEASDQSGNSSQQGYYLVVGDINTAAPVISSNPDTIAEVYEEYQYQVTATDADLDSLTYSLSVAPASMTIDNQSGLVTWTPSGDEIGDHAVTVRVSDGYTTTDQSFTLTVSQLVQAITTLTAVDGTGYISDFAKDANYSQYSMTLGERNDQDNQKKRVLTKFDFSSLNGKTIDSAVLRIYIDDDRSNNGRTAHVHRVKKTWIGNQVTWNKASSGANWQTAGAMGINDIDYNAAGSRYFSSNESLGQYKDFTLDVNQIQEMIDGTFTNNGFLIKMETESDDAYRGPNPISPTNGHQLLLTYQEALGSNQPPEITSTANTQTGENQLYTYQVTATDVEVPQYQTLTYSLTQSPTGMTINSSTGLISWTPDSSEIGDHTITIQVSDGFAVDTQTYVLSVLSVLSGTVTLTPTDATGYISDFAKNTNYGLYNITLGERNNQTNQRKRFLTKFDLSSLSGKTITDATLKVYINDDFSSNARSARVYRTKQPWIGNQVTWNSYNTGNSWQTPGATGANDIDTTEMGSRYFSSSESLNVYKEFSIDTAKLQEMVDGTFTDSGFMVKMDTEVDDAYYGPRAVDANYGNRLVVSFVELAGPNQAPVITSTTVTSALENQAYSYQVTADDPENHTLTYMLTQSPTGMSIDQNTGLISWTPATGDAGNHTVTVQVDDGDLNDSQTYTLTVSATTTGTTTLNAIDGTGYISDFAKNTNYGLYNMTLGERNDQGNQKKRVLTKFDISSLAGKIITSAKLKVYVNDNKTNNSRTARVYRVKQPWIGNQVTWNSYNTGNSWQTAGATGGNDIDTAEIGSRLFSANETLNEYKTFDLNTTAIQEIADGSFPDNGFLLKMDSEVDDAYYGPRPIDATYGHRLEVEYLEAQQTQSQTLLLSQPGLSATSLSAETTTTKIKEETDKPIGDTTLAPAESIIPPISFIKDMDLAVQYQVKDYLNQGGAIVSNNGIYYLVVIADKKITTYKITATELQEIHSFKDKHAQSADAVTIGDSTYLVIERGDKKQKLFRWKKEDKLVRVRSTIEKLTKKATKAETEQPSLWDQFTTTVSTTIAAINPFDDTQQTGGSGAPQLAMMALPASTSGSDITTYGTPDDNPYTSNHSFSYDDNGNLTSDGIQCYSYSEANRLTEVRDCGTNDLMAEYSYNDGGTRVRQKLYDNGSLIKTVYILSPFTELTIHASDNTEIINYYYFANDQLVARDSYEVGEPSSEQRFYYHQDHLGSTSVLTDSSGNVQESTEYAPYGGVLSGGTASKHQFTGQEYDHATGLNYYQSRYYNAYQRRFIQPDSIIPDAYDPQQLNPYAYVRNNPVKYVDPEGHSVLLAGVIAAAILFTTVAMQPQREVESVDTNSIQRSATENSKNRTLSQAMAELSHPDSDLSTKTKATGEVLGHGTVAAVEGLYLSYLTKSIYYSIRASLVAGQQPGTNKPREITVENNPEYNRRVQQAQQSGQPSTLTIDREGAALRRKEALRGIPTQTGLDRDEYPPAMFVEGGAGADVKYISPSANRSAGSCIMNLCKDLPNGSTIILRTND
jgi:RHS repeat-associated protein